MAELAAVDLLQRDIDRLQNAIRHLLSANADLKLAIEEEGDDDRTYKQAIEVLAPFAAAIGPCLCSSNACLSFAHVQENIVVIAKYRAKVGRLEEELQQLMSGQQLGGVAIPAAAGGAPDQQQGTAARDSDTAMPDAAATPQQAALEQAPGEKGLWL